MVWFNMKKFISLLWKRIWCTHLWIDQPERYSWHDKQYDEVHVVGDQKYRDVIIIQKCYNCGNTRWLEKSIKIEQ